MVLQLINRVNQVVSLAFLLFMTLLPALSLDTLTAAHYKVSASFSATLSVPRSALRSNRTAIRVRLRFYTFELIIYCII